MNQFLKSALWYQRNGNSVIPIQKNKKPFCKWEPYMTQVADEKQIRKWWDTAKEINALPPTPKAEFMAKAEDGLHLQAVDILLGQWDAPDADWNSEKLQSDSSIVLVEANKRSGGRLALPIEDSAHGTLAPVTPANTIEFQLSDDEYRDFRHMVYESGDDPSPDAIMRRSWDWLRTAGLDTSGKFSPTALKARGRGKGSNDESEGKPASNVSNAPEPTSTVDSTVVITKDPDKMTQGEYEAWRAAGNG